ncbi:gag-polypeptide of LTR copia-type [Sesbania bispinosa]|nr:gag-polypeptide of LTR copia-type [Sesbania bispinosa]
MVMKYTMEKSIQQSIPENDKAKDFLKSVGEKFKTFDKAQKVLESLPSQFNVLKTSYNTQKEEWTIDEMIAIVSQEEASIKKCSSLFYVWH